MQETRKIESLDAGSEIHEEKKCNMNINYGN